MGEFGDLLVARDKSQLLSLEKSHMLPSTPGTSGDSSAAALALTSAEIVDTLSAICQALLKGKAGDASHSPGAAAVAAAESVSASLASSCVTETLLSCLAKLAIRLPDQVIGGLLLT